MTEISIEELENPRAVSKKCHELNEPICVTKEGLEDMVVVSMETFQRYEDAVRAAAFAFA